MQLHDAMLLLGVPILVSAFYISAEFRIKVLQFLAQICRTRESPTIYYRHFFTPICGHQDFYRSCKVLILEKELHESFAYADDTR